LLSAEPTLIPRFSYLHSFLTDTVLQRSAIPDKTRWQFAVKTSQFHPPHLRESSPLAEIILIHHIKSNLLHPGTLIATTGPFVELKPSNMTPATSRRHHYQYSDEHSLYSPTWLTGPRGFVNFKESEADRFNHLIDDFIPWDVTEWDCGDDGWTFTFVDTKVRIINHEDGPILAISVSSRQIPRDVTESIRVELTQMLAEESKMMTSVIEFATLILRLLEATSTRIIAWRDAVRPTKLGLQPQTKAWQHGWDAKFVTDWESILENPFGVNLDSVADTRPPYPWQDAQRDLCWDIERIQDSSCGISDKERPRRPISETSGDNAETPAYEAS
jgi:hypothetical protein